MRCDAPPCRLNDCLDALEFNQVVIFVKSVQRAIALDKLLVECNFPSIAIHSGLGQEDPMGARGPFRACATFGGPHLPFRSRVEGVVSPTSASLCTWSRHVLRSIAGLWVRAAIATC